MDNRELLELAAKAAGIKLDPVGTVEAAGTFAMLPDGGTWDPLRNDGDALRLAVKLGLGIDPCKGLDRKGTGVFLPSPSLHMAAFESHGVDASAATRRAIVRAAADIGKSL